MKITLRQRNINGKPTLYLDYYHKGKRKIEYLKLNLYADPKTKAERTHNKEAWKLAKAIEAKKQIEVYNDQYKFKNKYRQNANFITYFEKLTQDRIDSTGNHGNWLSCLKYLKKYCGEDVPFKIVDTEFVEGFKHYLQHKARTKSDSPLSQNTQHSYFNKLKACLNQAFKDRLIPENPAAVIEGIKQGEPQKEYLSIEEVRTLAKTDCKYPILKKAFLFSCLTGMRWSDINKLTWGELHLHDGSWRVTFRQKKTKGFEYLDISDQAKKLIGEPEEGYLPEDRVFKGLKYSAYHNLEILRWCMRAGIQKKITFHCARHTFAVIQLELGTEIYTLSKLLGHSELKTTEIYAKIIDKKKKEAVNKIPDIEF